LLPLGRAAAPTLGDCFAAEREQAPSPHKLRSYRGKRAGLLRRLKQLIAFAGDSVVLAMGR
jgi:hypothetical protein